MKIGQFEASDFSFGDGDFSEAIAKQANAKLAKLEKLWIKQCEDEIQQSDGELSLSLLKRYLSYLRRDNNKMRDALKWYADKKNWETSTAWTASRGIFGEEDENRQPYKVIAAMEEDKGRRAREALF